MKRTLTSIIIAASILSSGQIFAQTPTTTPIQSLNVSVSSRGADVREVLHDLFGQVNKNYVVEPKINYTLFLTLKDVPFDEALTLICSQAKLSCEQQNGIYFITIKEAVVLAPKPIIKKERLPETVLDRKIKTRLAKVDIRTVFVELTKQTGVAIEVNTQLPTYKVDAYLDNKSLRFALDSLTKALGLKYEFTDWRSISISKPDVAETEGVTIHKDGS